MHYDLWAILFGSSLATGASLVVLLAAGRSKEPLAFVAGMVMLGTSSWSIGELVNVYGGVEPGVYAGLLAAAAAAGGYGLASSLLPLYAHKSDKPAPMPPVQEHDPRITVLMAAVVEPQIYSPASVAETLMDMAEAGLPEPTMGITPFLYAAQKARYRAAGGKSPSLAAALALTERVEAALDKERFGPVELVTCSSNDTLDAAVTRAAARGCTRVITAGIAIGESFELDKAKARVDMLHPTDAGMRVIYTPPLWGSEALAEDLARRIWTGRDDLRTTGVALVMHGQPESRERTHGVFDVHENAFCNRIRMLLAERGLPESNMRLCYLDWRDPDVTETVRHLAAVGCTRVIVMPACFPFESVSTILDLQVAARQARVGTNVHTLIMQPWGDDDVIAEVVLALIEEAERDLRG